MPTLKPTTGGEPTKAKLISGPIVFSRNDPAFKAYQDSLSLYNLSKTLANQTFNEETKNATANVKEYYRKIILDANENPGRYEMRHGSFPLEGSMFSVDKYSAAKNIIMKNDKVKGNTPFEKMINWEQEMIDYYKTNPYTEPDINGFTSKQRIAMHTSTLNILKKQKQLSGQSGILPTHITIPLESSFATHFKKPVAPPVLAEAKPLESKGLNTNALRPQLLSRPVALPKQNFPISDHNFYFGNAQAWKNPDIEVGYYNEGQGEGRIKVTMKELLSMEPNSRKAFLNSFGKNYNDQFEQAVKGMK